MAFGEVLFEEHSSSFSSPYLFNGKELDRETNLSYYGARYLDMKTSLWLTVDPKMEKYPGIGSYVFVANNPINAIDPNGEDIVFFTAQGAEIHRIKNDKVFETYVSSNKGSIYPGASPFGAFVQVPMPKTIQIYTDGNGNTKNTTGSKYQKYDYMIAALTYIFNQKKEMDIVPTTGGKMLSDASTVPDLDPTIVKAIIMEETVMGSGKSGGSNDPTQDIMQSNVYYSSISNDWNSDKKQFGLTKGGGATPAQSVTAGIGILFQKGLRDPDNGGLTQTKKWFGGEQWENAIRDYNGSKRKEDYKADVIKMVDEAK
ncbi:MAG: RHS repeat-associated core domain-containing protein [Flavobacterium sp.]